MMTLDITSWRYFLCTVAAFNIVAWSLSARLLSRRYPLLRAELYRTRRLQLLLSAVYVSGCAFRSAFPVYDVPRICLFDHWLSSVIVGRSIATVAELCFVAQWALMLNEMSRAARSALGTAVSLAVVPLIAVAEICSWYSVLTTSNLGHVAEESIWGLSVALLVMSVLTFYPRCTPSGRSMIAACCVAGVAYVVFMFAVDVPMYWSRWLADEASGRHYMSIAQGVLDVATRRVVTYQWDVWKSEVAWMSLYFSLAVWISMSLIHAPAPETHVAVDAGERRSPRVALGTHEPV
jgi:hypothetical protein